MARATRRAGNLPAEATSFIGRRRELAELRQKLSAARLVSLVGPGGVGKTRLAVRIATNLARGFRDGAWLVELAEVRDPALVSNAAVAALALRAQATAGPLALVLSYLQGKELLLVVDNCEHLLDAAARLVTEIIKAAPGVRVITTSREPLSAPGEHVVPVPPLELPSAHAAEPLSQLRQNEAIMLFTERAAAASGKFELTDSNQAAVVGLCRRLDGLPLAIELAAVRTRVLSAEQILDRLTGRFSLLTGGGRAALPRHQTLQATIDWSHELLAAGERTLLRRLCVFAGRFTLEDAEGACSSDDVPAARALDLMSSLIDKSLVIKEDAGGLACYRLHETMREYAGLKLRAAGEEEVFEERCAEYYVSWCRRSATEARYRLVPWLEWLDLEIDNIRSVLGRCLTRADVQRGIDLASSLGWYWITRATTEGARWLDELLAAGPGHSQAHARAHFMRGFLAVLQADPAAARPALERAAAAAQEWKQPRLLAESLSMASVAANMAGDRASGKRLLHEAQVIATGLDNLPARLAVLQAHAVNGFFGGDLGAVRSASSEGVRLSRETGDLYTLEIWLMNLGFAALTAGDLDEPEPLFAEALRIALQIDDRVAQFYLVGALGCRAAASGEHRLAAELFGASENLRAETGASVNAILAPLLARATESASAALGRSRFEAQFKAGALYSRDAAVGLALGEPTHRPIEARHDGRSEPLAKRVAEVARLGAPPAEVGQADIAWPQPVRRNAASSSRFSMSRASIRPASRRTGHGPAPAGLSGDAGATPSSLPYARPGWVVLLVPASTRLSRRAAAAARIGSWHGSWYSGPSSTRGASASSHVVPSTRALATSGHGKVRA
jgi:predicted ATPase